MVSRSIVTRWPRASVIVAFGCAAALGLGAWTLGASRPRGPRLETYTRPIALTATKPARWLRRLSRSETREERRSNFSFTRLAAARR